MIIVNGKIFTMEGEPIESGYVRIEKGKIVDVGYMSNYEKKQNDGEALDVKGAWVLPGLIEPHAHIGITEEKWGTIADDCNEATSPITASVRALDAVNPMDPAFHDAIAAGITSVMVGPGSANVVGGQFLFMKTQGRCIDHMVVKVPAAMKVAFGENPKTTYSGLNQCPATRMGIACMLRKTLFQASQYKKDKESGNLAKEDFEMEPWIPVLNKEIPLKAHAHRADDILTVIRIAKEFDIDITIDHGTESHLIVDEIVVSGFPVISGPHFTSRSKLEIQNMNPKTSKVLQEAGVLFSITTDHPVSMIQYLPLCAGLAVKNGLSIEDGLKAMTINAARICRVDDRVGSLKKGKDADIAIFTGNPMELFTKTLYTIIDGEIIYEDLP
ncbi:MAG: amidohydrolase [Lachnospiraceae bacterium]|nr:amidohydrolase [Lachnospiraceae bacterium]